MQAVYRLGVEDNGNPKGLTHADMHTSLCNLKKMADCNRASLHIAEIQEGSAPELVVVKAAIRRLPTELVSDEVRGERLCSVCVSVCVCVCM